MIIHKSLLPEVEIPNVSITEFILREADRVPDREALIDGPTGRTYYIWTTQRHDPRFRGWPCRKRFGQRRHHRAHDTVGQGKAGILGHGERSFRLGEYFRK